MSTKPFHSDDDDPDAALVLALASGASQRQAAKQTGISPATVARRMAQADFKARVAARRAELLGEASGRLTALMKSATATLGRLLKSPSDKVKLGAARAIIEYAVNIQTVVAFEERLAKLEAKR